MSFLCNRFQHPSSKVLRSCCSGSSGGFLTLCRDSGVFLKSINSVILTSGFLTFLTKAEVVVPQ